MSNNRVKQIDLNTHKRRNKRRKGKFTQKQEENHKIIVISREYNIPETKIIEIIRDAPERLEVMYQSAYTAKQARKASAEINKIISRHWESEEEKKNRLNKKLSRRKEIDKQFFNGVYHNEITRLQSNIERAIKTGDNELADKLSAKLDKLELANTTSLYEPTTIATRNKLVELSDEYAKLHEARKNKNRSEIRKENDAILGLTAQLKRGKDVISQKEISEHLTKWRAEGASEKVRDWYKFIEEALGERGAYNLLSEAAIKRRMLGTNKGRNVESDMVDALFNPNGRSLSSISDEIQKEAILNAMADPSGDVSMGELEQYSRIRNYILTGDPNAVEVKAVNPVNDDLFYEQYGYDEMLEMGIALDPLTFYDLRVKHMNLSNREFINAYEAGKI